ncbi:tetratricopeptide repeat protein [Nitrospira defluvii]|nr:tetratricopeptide repeat protein [Nitrospira defluvii]
MTVEKKDNLDITQSDLYIQGNLYLHRRDYRAALQCFEALLEETRHCSSTSPLIDLLLHLGNANAQLGKRDDAHSFYQEVLTLQKGKSDPRAVGLTLVNLGNLCRESRETKHAEAYYLEAEDLLINTSDELSLAILYSNLGLLAQDEGRLEEALIFLKKAIDLHKKTGYEEGLASTWLQLGRIYLRIEKDSDSEICFNYASSHYSSLGDPSGNVEAHRGLAKVYEFRCDTQLTRTCLIQILSLQKRFGLSTPQSDLDWLEALKKNLT